MFFFCKNHLRKSPGLPRAFCSWAREHFVSCARNELSSNFKGPVVAGGCHRGARQEPPPHGESGPLLKCTWNRSLSTRGGDTSPEGARKRSKVFSYRSRLEISVQQDFRQYMRTGIECSLFDFKFSSWIGTFWTPLDPTFWAPFIRESGPFRAARN